MRSRRSLQWLFLFLTASALLMVGCGDHDALQPPSALSYISGTAIYTKGVLITANSPSSTGGAVSAYSVDPALPAGLSLIADTGIISGTPTAVAATTTYTVTASNAAGSTTAFLTITVIDAEPSVQSLPNMGQQITPLAPEGSRFEPLNPDLADNSEWLAGQAVTTVVSPDRMTLLILTSGYNRVYRTDDDPGPYGTFFNWPDSEEYVFIYDISMPTPVKTQVVKIPNTYNGIVFDPSGEAFYVAGGVDDKVHIITRNDTGTWEESPETALALDHLEGRGLEVPPDADFLAINNRVSVKPAAAGVAISSDGQTMVVANYYNDSITVFKGGLGHWVRTTDPDFDLRPGRGEPGGEYPFWVVIKNEGANATAYVSSIRDREIVVVNLNGTPSVMTRIQVKGQPNKMTLNADQSLLYVAEDQSDTIDIIDTATNTIVETIPIIAPASLLPPSLAQLTGANPNSVTLSPDETELYVTNGNLNCIAVVALDDNRVVGLIPTGWYPNAVSFSGDGNWVYAVNAKSPTGPNPEFSYSTGPSGSDNGFASNQYNPQLIKAGLQSFPRPDTAQLATLSAQVAVNNRFFQTVNPQDAAVMDAVRRGIEHVIFVVKENRTYDQILGDLEVGNGDPDLAMFGETFTPNQHNLARTFVTLDNFFATSETSNDGWPWTTSARAPDVIERQFPVAYAGRGLSLDSEGLNRSVNVAIPSVEERQAANPFTPNDPDLLPGQTNVSAPDGPDNEVNTGYLWDAALRAGLTVRNYGFFVDVTLYNTQDYRIPLDRDPYATGTVVATSANAALTPYIDPYFRGFDNAFPDYWRFREWEREFDTDYADGDLPSLSLVRFMHDHTGNLIPRLTALIRRSGSKPITTMRLDCWSRKSQTAYTPTTR